MKALVVEAGYKVSDFWEECASHFVTYQKVSQYLYSTFQECIGELRLVSDTNEERLSLGKEESFRVHVDCDAGKAVLESDGITVQEFS